jgi:hypothetical protein
MAYVTRCPYCGAVWLLESKEQAETAPVRCSKCNNFFDASRDILCVPDSLFPEMAKAKETPTAPETPKSVPNPLVTPSFATPVTAREPASVVNKEVPPFPHDGVKEACDEKAPIAPVISTPVNATQTTEADPLEEKATTVEKIPEEETASLEEEEEPADSVAPAQKGIPLRTPNSAKEQLERLNNLMSDFSGRTEPTVGLPTNAPTTESKTQGKPENSVTDGVALTEAIAPKKKQKSSPAGTLLVIGLFLVILAVAAVIMNQSVIEKFPKTKPVFEAVCTKITCPGFYLKNIEAFAVTKAQLTNTGTPGSYTLEVTIINGSNIAQAVPHISLQLVDENDAAIAEQTLAPSDFLADPGIKSLGAGRSLSINVNMRTNATPSRCIATPLYPQQKP